MKLIVTALRPEAEPFISSLKLKRDLSITSHEIYRNNTHALIITGIGKIKSAIGTTLLLERYGTKDSVICNVGIAGAPKNYSIGELCLIHKVTEHATKRSYYPELQINSGFKEADLTTVDSPLTSSIKEVSSLADMEASGFFEAAQNFLAIERISLLKIVSDNFNTKEVNKVRILELITEHAQGVITYLDKFHEHIKVSTPSLLTNDEKEQLSTISSELSLTTSQKTQLLSKVKEAVVTNKKDRNKLFKEILHRVGSNAIS